jgi:hypothetical protein
MALVAASIRPVKRRLGEFVVRWCENLKLKPWEQTYGLHRLFSFWGFPNDEGRPYNHMRLKLKLDNGQMSLF